MHRSNVIDIVYDRTNTFPFLEDVQSSHWVVLAPSTFKEGSKKGDQVHVLQSYCTWTQEPKVLKSPCPWVLCNARQPLVRQVHSKLNVDEGAEEEEEEEEESAGRRRRR